MTALKILAGQKAYRHIQANGLSPEHVTAIFGASGAAKWLAIYGLDKAIFSQWLTASEHQIDLFGTSVGAFKLAAAAQRDSATALSQLANAYIDQHYEGKITAEQVNIETRRILDSFLTKQAISEILSSSRFNYHCASVRCLGLLASDTIAKQKLAMVKAFFLSLIGRQYLRNTLERAIFYSGSSAVSEGLGKVTNDSFTTYRTALTIENFTAAVLSSGSIPVIMPGVKDIAGAPQGVYRDGGLLDYHAVPENVGDFKQGVVLYPHFYTHLKEGWFDKFTPWRTVSAAQLDNTVLIGPSADFIQSLPGGEIPDRRDFYRFKDNDQERIRRWTIAKDKSNELGEEFLELLRSGNIAAVVKPL